MTTVFVLTLDDIIGLSILGLCLFVFAGFFVWAWADSALKKLKVWFAKGTSK